jgi:hypothetical protein
VMFDDADNAQPSRRKGTAAPLAQIKTRQIRRLRSPQIGEMLSGALAAEFGISALAVHGALFAQLPEIFGR